jgi:hypothetical protein
MKDKFTKRESQLIDLMLEKLLTVTESTHVSNGFCHMFCNKNNISKETYTLICHELHLRDLIKYNEKFNSVTPLKTKIKPFLNNGGMTEYWLKRNKLKNDFKISSLKSNNYFIALTIVLLVLGIIKSVSYICKQMEKQATEETLKQKEEVKEKSNTLVLPKEHIDSLNIPNPESNKTLNK